MDPATGGVIEAVANLGATLANVIGYGKRSRYDRLPPWLSPADFQQRDNTVSITIGAAVLLLIVLLILLRKK